jgi:DNA-binding transcriptional LysR family regulator
MELKQLIQFVTLAETLNFHRAAERLHIAQPPLSVSIRKLEEELGSQLFHRNQRGVSLTATGLAALPAAQRAIFHASEVRAIARDSAAGLRGTLSIGFVGSATYALLPSVLPAFRERFPQVEVVLRESSTIDLLSELERRVVDVAVIRLPLIRTVSTKIVVVEDDVLLAVVRTDSPFAGRDEIDLKALEHSDFIGYPAGSSLQQLVAMACHDSGFSPRVAQEARQVQTLLCLVESGLGVGLAPARSMPSAPPGLKFLRLLKPPKIHLGLGLSAELTSPLATNFAKVAEAIYDTQRVSHYG